MLKIILAILVSDNKLSNWTNITPAAQAMQLNSVASSGTDDNLFVAVGNQGDVQFSYDGVGKIWNKASLPDEASHFDLSSVAYGLIYQSQGISRRHSDGPLYDHQSHIK